MSEDRFESWWANITDFGLPNSPNYTSFKTIARAAFEKGKEIGHSDGYDEGYSAGEENEYFRHVGDSQGGH